MAQQITLLGDSIFDNRAYAGRPGAARRTRSPDTPHGSMPPARSFLHPFQEPQDLVQGYDPGKAGPGVGGHGHIFPLLPLCRGGWRNPLYLPLQVLTKFSQAGWAARVCGSGWNNIKRSISRPQP